MSEQSRFHRAAALFEQARELPPGEQTNFLRAACEDDPSLFADVKELLEHHQQQGGTLDQAVNPDLANEGFAGRLKHLVSELSEPGEPLDEGGETSEPIGKWVGPYKLLQKIGEGGMGTVYMAAQETPVRRKVAVKVIKPTMNSKEVIARFEAERQAVAMMDHQNIARVYDAGTTDDGLPFFAMELVYGVPITQFCDEHRMSVRQRLDLFVMVCQAMQHAHQKGIIHRDLKPSNVLICNYDGKPIPKIIDFGVAKATHEPLTDKTLFTEFGRVVGTLQYMSPEQAGLSHLDVDTRSDIYSLGVLLYELLTGTTPLDRQRFHDAALEKVLQLIREEEPRKPSTRISESGDAITRISEERGSSPKTLSSVVRGDLDWIVMKALEKDRGRRYETASGFAEDIDRYLKNEPVLASPPSARYQLTKFIRRHRGPVLAATLVVLALVAGIVGTTTFALLASQQKIIAEQQKELADEQRTRAQESYRLAQQALTEAVNKVVDDPRVKTGPLEDLRRVILGVQADFYREFLQLQGDDDEFQAARGNALLDLGKLTAELGQRAEANDHVREAIAVFERLVQQDPGDLRRGQQLRKTRHALANQLMQSRELDLAERLFLQNLADLKALLVSDPENADYLLDQAGNYSNLGTLYSFRLRLAREAPDEEKAAIAESVRQSLQNAIGVLEQITETKSDAHFLLAATKSNLVLMLWEQERFDEMEQLIQEALEHLNDVDSSNPDAPRVANLRSNIYNHLAVLYGNTGKVDQERKAYLDGLAVAEEQYENHPLGQREGTTLGNLQSNLGVWHREHGEVADSIEWFDKAIATLDPVRERNPNDFQTREFLRNAYKGKAEAFTELGRHAEALPQWDKTLEVDTGQYQNWFNLQKARTLARLQRIDEAVQIAEEIVAGESLRAQTMFDAGSVFALAAGNTAEDQPEREELILRAMELLTEAVDNAFDKPEDLAESPDLDSLRDRPDFQALVQRSLDQ